MSANPTVLAPAETPTRVRYGVLGFACSLSMITYLDRVCFGTAAGAIQSDLGLQSVAELKLAFTAFTVSYALFEIPTGWLGDVFGPRKTLIRIVLWWSVFTALTGTVTQGGFLFLSGLMTLALIRLLFGVGEAGAYPNITRALHNWFPASERAAGQGTVWMAGRFMGGLTPLVWLLVTVTLGLSWRGAFYLFGVLGVIWCIAFYWWFRDRPSQHPLVNAAEVELIEAGRTDTGHAHANVPWLKLLSSGNLWFLCLMYFCAAYGWYFNITYLPQFLETQYKVDPNSVIGSIYKGGPLLFGAMTCLIGGLLSDRFIRKTGNHKWGRRLFGIVGHSLCGVCYLACLITPTAFWFFLAISMAAFWNDLTMGAAWATCQDIGKRYSAIVAGAMNTIGNLGGACAGWITGTILAAYLTSGAAGLGVTDEDDQEQTARLVAAELKDLGGESRKFEELAKEINAAGKVKTSAEELVQLQSVLARLRLDKEDRTKPDARKIEIIAQREELPEKDVEKWWKLAREVEKIQKARLLLPGYRLNFLIFACVYFLAVFFWLRVDATKPVAPEAEGKG